MSAEPELQWRRSTFSSSGADCVELSGTGEVRDSKNIDGAQLRADLRSLLAAVKSDQLDN